jgi:hypothetical protein
LSDEYFKERKYKRKAEIYTKKDYLIFRFDEYVFNYSMKEQDIEVTRVYPDLSYSLKVVALMAKLP